MGFVRYPVDNTSTKEHTAEQIYLHFINRAGRRGKGHVVESVVMLVSWRWNVHITLAAATKEFVKEYKLYSLRCCYCWYCWYRIAMASLTKVRGYVWTISWNPGMCTSLQIAISYGIVNRMKIIISNFVASTSLLEKSCVLFLTKQKNLWTFRREVNYC